MALALLTNLDESQLKDLENPGKLCSGCDPDVPGHAEKSKCPVCKGKGFEPFSFSGAAAETAASKVPETPNAWGKGIDKGKLVDVEYDDGEALLFFFREEDEEGEEAAREVADEDSDDEE